MNKSINYYLNNLPIELYDIILKLTYKPQNHEVLSDIRNFVETKNKIIEYYHKKFISDLQDEEPEDICWLINDLYRYYNDDFPTMSGYTYGFISKICRHRYFRYFVWGDYVIDYLERKQDTTHINILWGLLKPHERQEFIEQFCINY